MEYAGSRGPSRLHLRVGIGVCPAQSYHAVISAIRSLFHQERSRRAVSDSGNPSMEWPGASWWF